MMPGSLILLITLRYNSDGEKLNEHYMLHKSKWERIEDCAAERFPESHLQLLGIWIVNLR